MKNCLQISSKDQREQKRDWVSPWKSGAVIGQFLSVDVVQNCTLLWKLLDHSTHPEVSRP